jgi:hypothetical protein
MKRLAFILAGLLVLGSGAVTLAAIPSADGTITGCRDNRTGALRVIDAEAGQSCGSRETALTWNQIGPAGPANTSVQVTRTTLASGAEQSIVLTCPSGTAAAGPPAVGMKHPGGSYFVDPNLHYTLVPGPVPFPDGPVRDYTLLVVATNHEEIRAELTCLGGIAGVSW